MLKGLNRATLAKAALPEYEAWFKRHDEFLTKTAELKFFTMLSEYDKKV